MSEPPEMLPPEKRDMSKLEQAVREYVNIVYDDDDPRDQDHTIFEEAIEAYYGDIWDEINEHDWTA